MDGSTLQKIRDHLLARREEIGQMGLNMERESGTVVDMSGNQAEMVDVAQALEQIERNNSLAEQERRELDAIERALAKIAMGQFGTCEDCEEEIPHKRLMVLPQARLCAKCQAVEERQQGRNRGLLNVAAR